MKDTAAFVGNSTTSWLSHNINDNIKTEECSSIEDSVRVDDGE